MAENGQLVIDLDRQRMEAMARKDLAALDALIAADLVYTHSTARLDTKESLLAAMQSAFDPREVWERIEWADADASRDSVPALTPEAEL